MDCGGREESLLGANWKFGSLSRRSRFLDKLVERTRGTLKTEIQHTDGISKVQRARNAHEVCSSWELVDSDERDYSPSWTNEEEGRPGLKVLGRGWS